MATINISSQNHTDAPSARKFHIFVINGEPGRTDTLCDHLTQRGYVCTLASNLAESWDEINHEAPDLVLIRDITMPVIQNISRAIRQENKKPIIALISEQELNSRQLSLGLVDDFVVEPFNIKEISLRITRLLGKTAKEHSKNAIRCGDLIIDTAKYEVYVGDIPAILTYTEYELLSFLVTNKGQAFSRETLLNKVWGYDYFGGDRTVDVHIKRLRSKIEDTNHTFIETVRHIGYKFIDQT